MHQEVHLRAASLVADPEEPLVSDLAADLEARLAADTRPAFVREDLKLCSCSLSDAALSGARRAEFRAKPSRQLDQRDRVAVEKSFLEHTVPMPAEALVVGRAEFSAQARGVSRRSRFGR